MMMVSGFRGVNLVDPERIARTEGLDMMLIVDGLVVTVDYDDTVAVRRRWLIGPEVPWLTEEDETVPRALEGGVVGQIFGPETTARSASGDVRGSSTKVSAFEVEAEPADVSETQ